MIWYVVFVEHGFKTSNLLHLKKSYKEKCWRKRVTTVTWSTSWWCFLCVAMKFSKASYYHYW